jgi:Concanavalin A-like lectin/glucanases superfamily
VSDPYRDVLLSQNPIAVWPLDEAVGATTMADVGPNGLNGTYDATNPPVLRSSPLVTTEDRTCGSFNGTNQKSAVNDNNLLDLVNSFSATAVVTTTSIAAGEYRWMGKGTVGANGYSFGRQAAKPCMFNMGVAAYVFSGFNLVVGTKYHMGFVFDAAQDVTCYINGSSVGLVTGATNITPGTAQLFIGVSDSAVGGEFWGGKIQYPALFGSILTAAQMKAQADRVDLIPFKPRRMPLGV